jgi:hypothetical protein
MGYCTTEKYRDMAYVYQNGIYTVLPPCYQHLEKYTQGHGIPPCIYQNGIWCRH